MKKHVFVVMAATVSSMALTLAVQAQCVPTMRGFSAGPIDIDTTSRRSHIATLMPYDDGSGVALYAAGEFTLGSSIQAHVAKYQNGQWTPMPMPSESQSNVQVRALAVQDFSSVGGPGRSIFAMPTDGRVYRWTGSQWSMVGTRQTNLPDALLATSDDQGPMLLMSRSGNNDGTSRVVVWRGSGDWTNYGSALTAGYVSQLRTIDDGSGPATFAVGNFEDSVRGIRNIAKFVNGEWTPVTSPDATSLSISDITVYDDGAHGPELYASVLNDVDSGPAFSFKARVYRLRDGAWAPIEAGDVSFDGYWPEPKFVKLDEGNGEKLHLAGYVRLSQQAGQRSGLVQMTPSGWQAPLYFRGPDLSIAGAVCAAVRYEDGGEVRTFLGGDFQTFASSISSWSLDNVRAYSLVKSDSAAPLGYVSAAEGLGSEAVSGFSGPRYALSPLNLPEGPRLLMAGPFARAGGLRALGAASFDGQAFTPLDVVASSGTTLQDVIHVSIDGEPRILAATDSALGPVAYRNGTQWQRFPQQPSGGTAIKALAVLNNEPVALMLNNLSVYRNGAWQVMATLTQSMSGVVGDLGDGPRFYFGGTGTAGVGVYQFDGNAVTLLGATPSFVVSMAIHDDGGGARLFIYGGGFAGLSRLNGSTFEPLAGSNFVLGGSGSLSLASFDDGLGPALYAAGGFANVGGENVNGFARWRNNQWEPVVPYVAPVPSWYRMGRTSMAVFNGRLYLAGDFTSIGTVSADHLAVIEPCPVTCSADYNHDGDVGTDLDIEAFFACLGGNCCLRCGSDFNNDGDFGTDGDIESFFRVLAGGPC